MYIEAKFVEQLVVHFLQVGRLENVVGWYHSHPGYGCWLSGIDVSTQMLNQQYQEPFLAVVIDPTRTVSAGKVEIGAFRTYPQGYKPPDEPASEYQTIPLNKIEDFGVHCKQVRLTGKTENISDLILVELVLTHGLCGDQS